jgi:hypothetical protein
VSKRELDIFEGVLVHLIVERFAKGFELHTHAKDDAVIKIDMGDGGARTQGKKIPLDCVVGSVGQSQLD